MMSAVLLCAAHRQTWKQCNRNKLHSDTKGRDLFVVFLLIL